MNEYSFSWGVNSWSVESRHRREPASTDTGHCSAKSSATNAGAESSHGERSAAAGHANAIHGKVFVLLISHLLAKLIFRFALITQTPRTVLLNKDIDVLSWEDWWSKWSENCFRTFRQGCRLFSKVGGLFGPVGDLLATIEFRLPSLNFKNTINE